MQPNWNHPLPLDFFIMLFRAQSLLRFLTQRLYLSSFEAKQLHAFVAAVGHHKSHEFLLHNPTIPFKKLFCLMIGAWQLKRQKPLAYLLGHTFFYEHIFEVNPHVLIPRPETEELVDLILKREVSSSLRILDLGTGSGNIAISLAIQRDHWRLMGVDCSSRALKVAQNNADRLLKDSRQVTFYNLDMLSKNFKIPRLPFDIIVCNPPYIATCDKPHLSRSVRAFEPKKALFAGRDGLLYYRRMACFVTECLLPKGRIYLEVGKGQMTSVKALFCGSFSMEVVKDMQQVERFLIGVRR